MRSKERKIKNKKKKNKKQVTCADRPRTCARTADQTRERVCTFHTFSKSSQDKDVYDFCTLRVGEFNGTAIGEERQ